MAIPPFVAGVALTAAELNVMIDAIEADFVAFTPVVKYGTAATGTHDSRWCRFGRYVIVKFAFKLTTGGTPGTLTATRPVPGRYGALSFGYAEPLGTSVYIAAAGSVYSGIVTSNLSDGTDIVFRSLASPSTVWTHTVPSSIAANDEIYATYTYEAVT